MKCNRFTLIELLVVVAIIAILASILLPALARAREYAHKTTCLNNEKQQYLALQLYADDFDSYYPRFAGEYIEGMYAGWSNKLIYLGYFPSDPSKSPGSWATPYAFYRPGMEQSFTCPSASRDHVAYWDWRCGNYGTGGYHMLRDWNGGTDVTVYASPNVPAKKFFRVGDAQDPVRLFLLGPNTDDPGATPAIYHMWLQGERRHFMGANYIAHDGHYEFHKAGAYLYRWGYLPFFNSDRSVFDD